MAANGLLVNVGYAGHWTVGLWIMLLSNYIIRFRASHSSEQGIVAQFDLFSSADQMEL